MCVNVAFRCRSSKLCGSQSLTCMNSNCRWTFKYYIIDYCHAAISDFFCTHLKRQIPQQTHACYIYFDEDLKMNVQHTLCSKKCNFGNSSQHCLPQKPWFLVFGHSFNKFLLHFFSIFRALCDSIAQGPENFKKSRQKNSWN